MTNNTFFDISKQIANEYLQSIIFIDDEVYAAQTDQVKKKLQDIFLKKKKFVQFIIQNLNQNYLN